MKIEKIPIDKLKIAEYNPRKNLKKGDREYEQIKKSIEAFEMVEPIIVNKDYTVIGGHQRLKILKELGYKEIECNVLDLTKEKEKALNVALNKISGKWDIDKLTLVLDDIKDIDIDVGFTKDEIFSIIANPEPDIIINTLVPKGNKKEIKCPYCQKIFHP